MVNKDINFKLKVVNHYLNNSLSIRKVAKIYGINYRILFKWIKRYRTNGPLAFLREHTHPLKIKPNIIRQVIKLREKLPDMSIRKMKEVLNRSGIKISLGALWKILRNYGYAGFKKTNLSNDFTDYVYISKKDLDCLSMADYFVNEIGDIKIAADVLNNANILQKKEILTRIPDEYLNIKRRIEKLHLLFGKVPLKEIVDSAKILCQEYLASKFYYSALRVGIILLVALSWTHNIKELNKWKKKLEKISSPANSSRASHLLLPIRFSLRIAEGFAEIHNNQIKKAIKSADACSRMIKKIKSTPPYLMSDLALLYLSLEKYDKAENLIKKAICLVDEKKAERLRGYLARSIYFPRGEFKKALTLLKFSGAYAWERDSIWYRFRASYFLINGRTDLAESMYEKALEFSQQSALPEEIIHSYIGLACVYAALNESDKSQMILSRLSEYITQKKLKRFKIIVDILRKKEIKKSELLLLPTIRTAWLLKNKGFVFAKTYAMKKRIIFQFLRYLLFFPESVKKTKKLKWWAELPKALLRLPVFNAESVVIKINFLGKVKVYRNKILVKERIEPKKQSLLVFLAHKISEPQSELSLEYLYENFWHSSPDYKRNLSRYLSYIRNLLGIPGYYLEIKRQGDNSILVNNNLYFHTDYQEFEQTIARARALQRAGEWSFAKKEYLRAFKLFRGEPFKKNFDDWSVNLRFKILTEFESEAINFAKNCIEHNNRTAARRILMKVLKIIPDSEEAKKLIGMIQT